MKFFNMGNRGLAFDVNDRLGKVAIPAGTTGVKIAFGQSPLVRTAEGKIYTSDSVPENGKRLNVYLYKSHVYHG